MADVESDLISCKPIYTFAW